MPDYDAFLLVSFGGPEGPDDVMPFLENVTRGRGIPRERLAAVAEHYYAAGGVSPINQQCRDLLAAIGKDFAAAGLDLPVYWGNRNWDAVPDRHRAEMAAAGVHRALAFVTSAYGSYSSCRQYLDDIERAAGRGRAGRPADPQAPALLQPSRASSSRSPSRQGGGRGRCRRRAGAGPAGVHRAQRAGGDGGGQRPAARRPVPGPAPGGGPARRGAGRRGHRGAPMAAGLPEPQRAASQPWLGPDVVRPPDRAGRGRGAGRGAGPGRVRHRSHGGRARPGRGGGAAGQRAGPAAGPGGHAGDRPALRVDDHRAGPERLDGPVPPAALGSFGPAEDFCRPDCCRWAAPPGPRGRGSPRAGRAS